VSNTLSDVRPDLVLTPLPGVAGFAVGGEIDESNRWILAGALNEAVSRGGDVHLDMSDVTFLDVATATLVVGAAERLRGRGELLIHHPPYELSFLLGTLWPGAASIEADGQ
jgi:ABC-type transporter Mla MlaB component